MSAERLLLLAHMQIAKLKEQNGQLRTMKGTPFKTITAAAGNHKADGGPAISDRGLACVYKIVLALVLTW